MISKNKVNGVVYTPKYIADFMIGRVNISLDETILEPSVGHGIFLEALLDYIEHNYMLSAQQELDWLLDKVFAGDIDKASVELVKDQLVSRYLSKGLDVSTHTFAQNIFVDDFLFSKRNIQPDVIIGNPPYVRIQNMEDSYVSKLRSKFQTTKTGNVDLYFAFIEHSLNLAKKVSFIVPNTFFSTKSGLALREKLSPRLNEIVDFECEKVFPGVGTYTTIILANEMKSGSVNVLENAANLMKGAAGVFVLRNKDNVLNKNGWRLAATGQAAQQGNLRAVKDLAIIHSPVATLRDNVFIKSPKEQKELKLEAELLVPFFKLTKVNKEKMLQVNDCIIYPYVNGKLRQEASLSKSKTIKYLATQRHLLDARDKGKTEKHEAWYAYGRKQGLAPYTKGSTLIILPQMFKNIAEDMFVIENPYSNFLFSSGFILEISNKEDAQIVIDALRAPKFNSYLISKAKKWPGEYYTFSVNDVKNFTL